MFEDKQLHLIKQGWTILENNHSAINRSINPFPNHTAIKEKKSMDMITNNTRDNKGNATLNIIISMLFYIYSWTNYLKSLSKK